MDDFSQIFNHISAYITLSDEERKLLSSVLRIKKVKRKQFAEQPGYVSRCRSYVISGALRAFFVTADDQEHTVALAIEDWWIGDIASYLLQEPATLFVEAIEDSTLIQWSYEEELLLIEEIPQFPLFLLQRAQYISIILHRRLIANLNVPAEERYNEFARNFPILLQRIPLYIIASYLGMTREFLSKIRNQKVKHK